MTTSRKLEKVAMDMVNLSEGKYALVAIDYFTRAMWAKDLDSKRTRGILTEIERRVQESGQKPEEMITDNGKEFWGEEFTRWCIDRGIRHRSNGRVERAIGTIREGLAKRAEGRLEEGIVEAYNNTLHTAIGCTPREAWEEDRDEVQMENSAEGKYAERKKKGHGEDRGGQLVRIARREKLGAGAKKSKGRFQRPGEVMMDWGDSYLIRGDGETSEKAAL